MMEKRPKDMTQSELEALPALKPWENRGRATYYCGNDLISWFDDRDRHWGFGQDKDGSWFKIARL